MKENKKAIDLNKFLNDKRVLDNRLSLLGQVAGECKASNEFAVLTSEVIANLDQTLKDEVKRGLDRLLPDSMIATTKEAYDAYMKADEVETEIKKKKAVISRSSGKLFDNILWESEIIDLEAKHSTLKGDFIPKFKKAIEEGTLSDELSDLNSKVMNPLQESLSEIDNLMEELLIKSLALGTLRSVLYNQISPILENEMRKKTSVIKEMQLNDIINASISEAKLIQVALKK